eukprot:3559129-Karenia_brevis.AAC.1
MNTGASASVCAGICGSRIVLWEYLPKKWNGSEAAKLYEGAIIKTLKKHKGKKRKYLVFEDNDPSGFKSNLGQEAKERAGIKAVPSPTFSPDLNPLDFSLWKAIQERMMNNMPKEIESVDAYKKRLRLTALRLPSSIVLAAVEAIPGRMAAIIKAKGYSIKTD